MSTNQYFGRDLEAMSFAKNYTNWFLDIFKPYIHGKVVEVGAGTGNISKILSENDSIDSLDLFEPSDNVYPILAENLSSFKKVTTHHAQFGDKSANLFEASLNSILYINVLEHIEDDSKELELMYNALKAGGHICIFVPAMDFLYSDFDKILGHFRRYHKNPLKKLIKAAGFEIVKASYFDIFGVLPWYIVFTLLGKNVSAENVKLYDNIVVPFAKVFEKIFPLPFGKNVLIVGRKNA